MSLDAAEAGAPVSLTERALAFVEAVEHVSSVEELSRLFVAELKNYGLKLFTSTEVPSVGDAVGNLHASTFPDDFLLHYIEHNYINRDPAMRFVGFSDIAFIWSSIIERGGFAPRDMAIMQAPKEFGIDEGVVVPLHGEGGSMSAVSMGTVSMSAVSMGTVSMCGDAFEGSPEDKRALHFMAIHFHERMKDLLGRRPVADENCRPLLTLRERECLHWAANGKSDWDIGEILGVAQTTTHEHIERAKRKLGVTTRVQAVVLAMKRGEIRP